MALRLPLLALAGTLALSAGQGRAEPLPQGAAVVTPLGAEASAVTYWVDGPEGFRVVTTVASGDADRQDPCAVVRLSTVLRPGQTQTVSVPGPAGSPPRAMLFRRSVGGVEVLAGGSEPLTN